jgi:hypothetical protein
MAETAHTDHPKPPHAEEPKAAAHTPETSERQFRRRLVKALTTLNFRDLRAMQKEELFEPHMHLFLMIVAAFAIGVIIWVVEPRLMG